jgi:hypothetical protein
MNLLRNDRDGNMVLQMQRRELIINEIQVSSKQ